MLEKARRKLELRKEIAEDLYMLYNSYENEQVKFEVSAILDGYKGKSFINGVCLLMIKLAVLNDKFFVEKIYKSLKELLLIETGGKKDSKKLKEYLAGIVAYTYINFINDENNIKEFIASDEVLSDFWNMTDEDDLESIEEMSENIDEVVKFKEEHQNDKYDEKTMPKDILYMNQIMFSMLICQECMLYKILKVLYPDKVKEYENVDVLIENGKNELLMHKFIENDTLRNNIQMRMNNLIF